MGVRIAHSSEMLDEEQKDSAKKEAEHKANEALKKQTSCFSEYERLRQNTMKTKGK